MKKKMTFVVLVFAVFFISFASVASAKLERKRVNDDHWQLFDGNKQITNIAPFFLYNAYATEEEKETNRNYGVMDFKVSGQNALFLFKEAAVNGGAYVMSIYFLNCTTGKYVRLYQVEVVDRKAFFFSGGPLVFKITATTQIRGASNAVVFSSEYGINLMPASPGMRSYAGLDGKLKAVYGFARKGINENSYDYVLFIREKDKVEENDGFDYIVGAAYKTDMVYLINTATSKVVSTGVLYFDDRLEKSPWVK